MFSEWVNPQAASAPVHPARPARVSELMLPARGTVARLLAPRLASALFARLGTQWVARLRPDSGAGERCCPVIGSGNLLQAQSYDSGATPAKAPDKPRASPDRADRATIPTMSMTADRLHFTGDEAADRYLVEEPLALLIGFALDQQVTVQKAFSGPLELRKRLGHLDAARIAAMEPTELDHVFRERPALHRFPGSMAGKIQELCRVVADRYGNDAGRIWREAKDGVDLRDRLKALPGFGDMKVQGTLAILGKRLGVRVPGLDDVMPGYPTLGDVDSPEALARYQEGKRAYKAQLRAAGESFRP